VDPAIKSLSRSWWIYLVAVGVSAGALIAAGERSISPNLSNVIDLSASRTGSIPELAKSKEWMSQVKFFNKNFLGAESSEWHNPPASQDVSAEIAQPQPTSDALATLSVVGPTEVLEAGAYDLRVRAHTFSRDLNVPANVDVGPLFRDGNPVSFTLTTASFFPFFRSNQTLTASFIPGTAAFDRPVSLDLPVLEGARKDVGHYHLHLQLQLKRLDPNHATVEDKNEAAGEASDIDPKAVKGKLAFDELAITDERMITPAGRYTTLIISADKDPRKYVRCTRLDTNKQIGAYSDRFPLVAVAVNGWASVKVRISVHDPGEVLNYRIIGLSADEVANKAMLLWFVGHDLTTKEAEGRVLSLPEIDARAVWLKQVLDVQFSEEEVQNIENPDVRQLVEHLRNLQSTNGQLP
jgi:hypothetical protein